MGFDLKSWMAGFAMGRAAVSSALMPRPYAYLYNGHRLPPLPQWDRENYPYAFILIPDETLPNGDYAALYVLAQPPIWDGEYVSFEPGTALRGQISGEEQWPELTPAQADGVMADYIRWSNVDISDGDGTVLLAASHPVPVYERR